MIVALASDVPQVMRHVTSTGHAQLSVAWRAVQLWFTGNTGLIIIPNSSTACNLQRLAQIDNTQLVKICKNSLDKV